MRLNSSQVFVYIRHISYRILHGFCVLFVCFLYVCVSLYIYLRNVLNVDDLHDHHNNRISNTSFYCTRFLSCVHASFSVSFDISFSAYSFCVCVCVCKRDYVLNVELTINGICVIQIKFTCIIIDSVCSVNESMFDYTNCV